MPKPGSSVSVFFIDGNLNTGYWFPFNTNNNYEVIDEEKYSKLFNLGLDAFKATVYEDDNISLEFSDNIEVILNEKGKDKTFKINFKDNYIISDTIPTNTKDGLLWFNPEDSKIRIYKDGKFSMLVTEEDIEGLIGSGEIVGILSDLEDVTLTNPQNAQALIYQDGVWINSTINVNGTNLSLGTVTSTDLPIVSSTGNDIATLPAATSTLAGIVTATNQTFGGIKTFNDGLATNSTGLVANLNADLLDNQHGTYYLNYNNFTNVPTELPPSTHSITSHTATAWRMFYSNATTSAIQELSFGNIGTYLRSGGASANPAFAQIAYSELSGTPTIGDGTLTLNVSGTGLSGSTTFTANQTTGSTFTVTSNATTAATPSTIVARDASGDIRANTKFYYNEKAYTEYNNTDKSIDFVFTD
jgi:hypothetical protein